MDLDSRLLGDDDGDDNDDDDEEFHEESQAAAPTIGIQGTLDPWGAAAAGATPSSSSSSGRAKNIGRYSFFFGNVLFSLRMA